ncbi:Rne/Rng family ribonuclease [Paracoccaceae bacterium GXU_MW_L88]
MAKKMLIDATHAEETRVVVVDGNKVDEFDFESLNKRPIGGNIYLAKVTRVEPSLQAAFVDYGGNRHGFLAFNEVHPDYYQIPAADRQKLIEEEEQAEAARKKADGDGADTPEENGDEGGEKKRPRVRRSRKRAKAEDAENGDAVSSDENGESGPDIEKVGAEDVKEEIAPRAQPRRKYKIQEVIKVRQILLVQVVKEERGNKGAALTTYLSLAGRYCVLMPNTARGGGISRKITNATDRKKLKEIAGEIEVPKGAGLIIRTAGAKRTRTEIKRDYEYLLRLWEQIRDLTMESHAPSKIYEEGSLIKRSIRDLYNREIDEVMVEGENGYREAKDYMKMLMPSHARRVKHYNDPLPLYARYQVESTLSGMFDPTVQLKSGGYIVIGVTEALVAIDVNSGRATKEGSIEETALKTNLEAAEEVARQLRLRDLAGLIVIDFIDMDERKNNNAVEKKLKDALKNDRARIQVGRISGFGLLEMSRQRLRQGMVEATTAPCAHCHGTGVVRSDDSLALNILRQLEEEGVRKRSAEVLVRAPVHVANYILNEKRDHLIQIEQRYGLVVRIEGDTHLISPDYAIDRFKDATSERAPATSDSPVISSATTAPLPMEEEDEAEEVQEDAPQQEARETQDSDEQPRKKRKRKRRRKGKNGDGQADGQNGDGQEGRSQNGEVQKSDEDDTPSDKAEDQGKEADTADAPAEAAESEGKKPRVSRSRSRRGSKKDQPAPALEAPAESEDAAAPAAPLPEAVEAPSEAAEIVEAAAPANDPVSVPEAAPESAPAREPAADNSPEAPQAAAPAPEDKPAKEVSDPKAPAETSGETESKPKRRGWWSLR